MIKFSKLLALLFTIIFVQGCSSILSIANSNNATRECDSHIYGGTKLNTKIIAGKGWLFRNSGFKYIVIIDYPFSFAVDTVAIPYTVYKARECKKSLFNKKHNNKNNSPSSS